MLVRVLPEKVSEYWDFFAPAIYKSLPIYVRNTENVLADVLRCILLDELDVWVYYNKERDIVFVMTTHVRTDTITKSRSILIYSFTSFMPITKGDFVNTLETIGKHAKSYGCNTMSAYVAEPKLIDFLKSLGANTNNQYVIMEA